MTVAPTIPMAKELWEVTAKTLSSAKLTCIEGPRPENIL
jgi:hypothetical protein